MRVLVQLRSSPESQFTSALNAGFEADTGAQLEHLVPGIALDRDFPPVGLSTPAKPGLDFTSSVEPETTHLVRGTIADNQLAAVVGSAMTHPDVVGVFSDPDIESGALCGGDPALGTDQDVAQLLAVDQLAAGGMDGKGVLVAVVDTGINLSHLADKGRHPDLDVARSWTPPGVATTPGQHPLAHGTMCAFDVGIAAPAATLADYAVLLSKTKGETAMAGVLSDAIVAYSNLLQLLIAMPEEGRAVVVTNSWGAYTPVSDFPPGHAGNYSDNPSHPFNVVVASLEAAGADILFAAGNCGRDCPDRRCKFPEQPISGANSHPNVVTVAAVDINSERLGYSSQGPGRLTPEKPDIVTYAHFVGSGVSQTDSGTSAACPVAAGVIAAIRSKFPSSKVSPAELRSLLAQTAADLGDTGFDNDYGWGLLDSKKLVDGVARLAGSKPVSGPPLSQPAAASPPAASATG